MLPCGRQYRKLVAMLALTCLGASQPAFCQNWVPNPGFEESDSCINGIGLLPPETGPTSWFRANITFDYLQSCLPYGAVNGLPMNMFTFQEPYEGNSCVGLFTYAAPSGEDQREWIMVPLLETLVPGQTYYCSFRANAGFGGNDLYPQIWLASNHVGMLFTTYARHWNGGDSLPSALNRADIQYNQILIDTIGWTLVSGSFVADSAYTYLMIGNFFSNALTDTLHFADPNTVFPWYDNGYTLIDAVCVSPVPNGCELEQGVAETANSTPYVFPNPATDDLFIGHAAGTEATVSDMLGRRIWHGKVDVDRYAVEVGSWARGPYVLQVSGAGRLQFVKFMLTE